MNKATRNKKIIVLTGGGTAGHILPNLALIRPLREAAFECIYMGASSGMDKSLVSSMSDLAFYGISSGKLRRYFDWQNFVDLFRILKGFFQSVRLLRQIKADIIFSKGGFVSVPVVWAGRLLKIPVVLHESDITPGLANRMMIPFAQRICTSFEESQHLLPPQKVCLTGIPVRTFLLEGSVLRGKKICGFNDSKKILMFCGGSQGSAVMDHFVRKHLKTLLKHYHILHLGKTRADHSSLPEESAYTFFEFVRDELNDLYACADIVITRAGANTLFELLCLQKPLIMIPLPLSCSRGEQIANATSFVASGYGELLRQEDLEITELIKLIEKIEANYETYQKAMKKSSRQKAAEKIVSILKEALR